MDAHALSSSAVRAALATTADAHGLTRQDAAARLVAHGPNALPAPKRVTVGKIVLHQLLSPLIYVLLAAAVVAVVLRDFVDAGFIVLVISINAALGASQEWRAEKSAAALQDLLKIKARVRRDGTEHTIAAEDIVPGDIVLLESGNRVPADLRLTHVTALEVDESFLTGESVTVHKHTDPVAADATVGDRRNMAFAGATVLAGRAVGIVTATGTKTQVGEIALHVSGESSAKSPLVVRMERFARQISIIVLGVCALLAMVAVGRGMPAVDVFFLAVALAVSAIPEGLPVAVTVALSIATRRMARRNVIVRRLAAVEGLGSCTIIASDKTGTLTINRQTVRALWLPPDAPLVVSGEGYSSHGAVLQPDGTALDTSTTALAAHLAWTAVRCNEGQLTRKGAQWIPEGDAVDVALLALGYKLGQDPAIVRDPSCVVAEIPFESSLAMAATFHRRDGDVQVAVKGALEKILPRCTGMRTAQGLAKVDITAIEAQADAMAVRGQRFVAVAEGVCHAPVGAAATAEDLPPLTFLGLIGLLDPARPEAKHAVAQCRAAGVAVAMVTGDHPRTAFAIAQELGIATDDSVVVTGQELAQAGKGSPAFIALVARGRVFARVAPVQKREIVEALREAGHFVAVTGDGVNDAPALKAGNIGVAMGSGSDVTKDTASLIVTDDNFASIEAGVEEGRFAYDNIRKVTYLLISTGLAEVILVLSALLLGLPLPLLAVQLLWLNLVTNGIQDIALAFEAGEAGAMQRPPRKPTEGIFNQQMIRQVVFSGAAMGVISTAYFWKLIQMGTPEESARNQVLMLFVLMQNVHVFNCRSEHTSAFRVPLSRNRVLAVGVLMALGVHIAATYLPFMQRLLRTQPLLFEQWAYPLVLALLVIVLMELSKWQQAKRRR